MAKCGLKEEVVVPYKTFTLQVKVASDKLPSQYCPQYIAINLSNLVQGTKPFYGIEDHEGVAFMSTQF